MAVLLPLPERPLTNTMRGGRRLTIDPPGVADPLLGPRPSPPAPHRGNARPDAAPPRVPFAGAGCHGPRLPPRSPCFPPGEPAGEARDARHRGSPPWGAHGPPA